MPAKARRPDLEALVPYPVSPPLPKKPVSEALASCDKLAANPFDRDRRAPGITLDGIDGAKAKRACAAAALEAPDDLTTAYQIARIEERLNGPEVAMPLYLAVAQKGYAAAIQSVARLLDGDAGGRLKVLAGDAAASTWHQRALDAGDTFALRSDAARLALSGNAPEQLGAAFSRVIASGVQNRISAARVLFIQGLNRAQTEAERSQALFLGMLAMYLEETDADPAPDLFPSDKIATHDRLRALCAELPAPVVVAAYRSAAVWKAGN